MRARTMLAVGFAAVLLTGCRNETASFMIDGSALALTLEFDKPYLWSADWNIDLIVRADPECQRRHALKPTADESPKIDVYMPEPRVFILRQNKRWYVTEARNCQFQTFKEAPPVPGTLVGTFQEVEGRFKFVKTP